MILHLETLPVTLTDGLSYAPIAKLFWADLYDIYGKRVDVLELIRGKKTNYWGIFYTSKRASFFGHHITLTFTQHDKPELYRANISHTTTTDTAAATKGLCPHGTFLDARSGTRHECKYGAACDFDDFVSEVPFTDCVCLWGGLRRTHIHGCPAAYGPARTNYETIHFATQLALGQEIYGAFAALTSSKHPLYQAYRNSQGRSPRVAFPTWTPPKKGRKKGTTRPTNKSKRSSGKTRT